MSIRVLVTGGRDYDKRERVYSTLDALYAAHGGIALLIHGGAKGADLLASEWATKSRIPSACYVADWLTEGRSAGPRRNQRMLDEAKPDLVVAFPGGRGTADMVQRAEAAGVPVVYAHAVVPSVARGQG